MMQRTLVGIQTIQTVFVGAYPATPMAVDNRAVHTCLANVVALTKFVTHVLEAGGGMGLHENALLHQAKPNVTTGVFHNAVNLAHREVNVAADVGVVGQHSRLGVVNTQAKTVVAEHHPAIVKTE